jgi:hypothetical protein
MTPLRPLAREHRRRHAAHGGGGQPRADGQHAHRQRVALAAGARARSTQVILTGANPDRATWPSALAGHPYSRPGPGTRLEPKPVRFALRSASRSPPEPVRATRARSNPRRAERARGVVLSLSHCHAMVTFRGSPHTSVLRVHGSGVSENGVCPPSQPRPSRSRSRWPRGCARRRLAQPSARTAVWFAWRITAELHRGGGCLLTRRPAPRCARPTCCARACRRPPPRARPGAFAQAAAQCGPPPSFRVAYCVGGSVHGGVKLTRPVHDSPAAVDADEAVGLREACAAIPPRPNFILDSGESLQGHEVAAQYDSVRPSRRRRSANSSLRS